MHSFLFQFMKTIQNVCILNGYGPTMRIFAKITKIPLRNLRKKDHVSIIYTDDRYLQGKTYEQCFQNITGSINILQELGFTIHPIKLSLTPKQNITFQK